MISFDALCWCYIPYTQTYLMILTKPGAHLTKSFELFIEEICIVNYKEISCRSTLYIQLLYNSAESNYNFNSCWFSSKRSDKVLQHEISFSFSMQISCTLWRATDGLCSADLIRIDRFIHITINKFDPSIQNLSCMSFADRESRIEMSFQCMVLAVGRQSNNDCFDVSYYGKGRCKTIWFISPASKHLGFLFECNNSWRSCYRSLYLFSLRKNFWSDSTGYVIS